MYKLSPIFDLRIVLKLSKQGRPVVNQIQKQNLFWIKQGYLFFFVNSIKGEVAARALRILMQWLPLKEISKEDMVGVEEVFYVDPAEELISYIYSRNTKKAKIKFKNSTSWPVFSVRQIGSQQLGNSRLYARKLLQYYSGKETF